MNVSEFVNLIEGLSKDRIYQKLAEIRLLISPEEAGESPHAAPGFPPIAEEPPPSLR